MQNSEQNTIQHVNPVKQVLQMYRDPNVPRHLKYPATQIFPWLFLGNINDANDYEWQTNNRIGVIFSMCPMEPDSLLTTPTYKLRIVSFAMKEEYEMKYEFDAAADMLEKCRISGHKVLLHCYAGINRSVSILAGYMMKYKHMTMFNALSVIRQQREIACPLTPSIEALHSYEQKLYGTSICKIEDRDPVLWSKTRRMTMSLPS